jgi:hypothetical protein
VTVLPFPTAVAAAYVGHGERVAAAVYTGTFLFIACVWNGLWRYAAGRPELLAPDAARRLVRSITRAYNLGLALYAAAFVVGLIRPLAGLGMCALLAVYFALPDRYTRWFGRGHESARAAANIRNRA